MRCPFCHNDDTQVLDTRVSDEGDTIRRRRRCAKCDKRFTTYERVELALPAIVKKNGSRVEYSHDKLASSIKLALRKRPVSSDSVDESIARIEEKLLSSGEREILSGQIGELVMRELKRLATQWQINIPKIKNANSIVKPVTENNPIISAKKVSVNYGEKVILKSIDLQQTHPKRLRHSRLLKHTGLILLLQILTIMFCLSYLSNPF